MEQELTLTPALTTVYIFMDHWLFTSPLRRRPLVSQQGTD